MGKRIFTGIIFGAIFSLTILIFAGNGFAQPQGEDFIKQEDKNQDGKVARDEFKGPSEHFDFFDKNKDGFIELSEAPGPENTPPGGPPGAGQAVGTGMPKMEVPKDAKPLYGEAFIKKFDFDKDGKVNHDEWEGIKGMTVYTNNHFPDFDKNRDGFITIDEAPKQ
jgi:Ca2+-binding EF-hand superfamily protein